METSLGTFATRLATTAQVIIAIALTLAILYLGKPVLVTIMVSGLIAFMLEPVVRGLELARVPRPAGAFFAVLVLLVAAYGASYFFYYRAIDFAQQLPQYTARIRTTVAHFEQQTRKLEQTKEKIVPPDDKNVVPVKVQESPLTRYMSAATEVVMTLAYIPFLVYFMLNWHHHARRKTVKLFSPDNRATAQKTLDEISSMMRSFITGNLMAGLVLSICSTVVFAFLHLPYFYFVGIISGFLSLVPYFGMLLAVIAPLAVGLGTLTATGVAIVVVTVIALHVLGLNVLYPKLIGRQLELNPLVVTVGLLIWGYMWGAAGLILAIPMMGTIKIVCDHLDGLRPIGDWLGE